ncbi:hypothetical protein HHK36_029177 [Tetracentron sinense]|uniref:Longin domain-containing protein n=1 Tax=Tetracentron sinense TaxID=13715 RepID=A0A834YGC7_TETSI|nr:hypothetical protein HHK36_029177 [Tetracentron sinense]
MSVCLHNFGSSLHQIISAGGPNYTLDKYFVEPNSNPSMISDPNLILYACVSNGTTVLAELSSGDLETLAFQCLEKIPPFHAILSHTVRKRTYSFLMEDQFVYFAIHHEALGKPQGFWFLERVKDAFTKFLKRKPINPSDNLSSHCFHKEFSPVFRQLMVSSGQVKEMHSPEIVFGDGRNGILDSRKGKKVVSAMLLGKPSKNLKKKLSDQMNGGCKDISMENKVDVNVANLSRELLVLSQNNGSYMENGARREAQKSYKVGLSRQNKLLAPQLFSVIHVAQYGYPDEFASVSHFNPSPICLTVACIGLFSALLVVWNPWEKKSKSMVDFGDEEYKQMLCDHDREANPLETGRGMDRSIGALCSPFRLLQ